MFNSNEIHVHSNGKLKLRSHKASYCLVEVVTKAGLTVYTVVPPFSQKATPLIMPNFRCAVIVKYYLIAPLYKGHIFTAEGVAL